MYSFYDFMQVGGTPSRSQGSEPDGSMALGQIDAAMDKLQKLRQFIQPESDLEPWVSSKLTLMDHYTDAVSDYMMYNPEAKGQEMEMMEGGGYVVTRSNDRKGKTHKVTGPDGTVKYFGDSKLGQHPKDPERKAAFYARHKNNLEGNPYFRAFARETWEDGGETNGLPKYQTAGWVQRAADAKLNFWEKCGLASSADNGGGGGGYYVAREEKPVNPYKWLADLSNDAWFGREELKEVRRTRPKGVNEEDWNALNADARRVTNYFTNRSVWDADKINPKTGRLDDKYLGDEWKGKINIANKYRYYNNVFKDKTGPVSAQDLYNYYSSQPGGLDAFRKLVERDYLPEQRKGGSTNSGMAWYDMGGYVPEYGIGGMPCYECGGGVYKMGGAYQATAKNKGKFTRGSKPMMQSGGPVAGDEMEVTPEQLEQLRAQGYQFEII
jgi:hypothetical protein